MTACWMISGLVLQQRQNTGLGRAQKLIFSTMSGMVVYSDKTQMLVALKKEQGAVSEADAIAALHELNALWSQLFPAEQARIIQLRVRRVTVTAAGLEVDIRREGITGVIREMVTPRQMEAAE